MFEINVNFGTAPPDLLRPMAAVDRYANYATEHLAVAAARIEGKHGLVQIPNVFPTARKKQGLGFR